MQNEVTLNVFVVKVLIKFMVKVLVNDEQMFSVFFVKSLLN